MIQVDPPSCCIDVNNGFKYYCLQEDLQTNYSISCIDLVDLLPLGNYKAILICNNKADTPSYHDCTDDGLVIKYMYCCL